MRHTTAQTTAQTTAHIIATLALTAAATTAHTQTISITIDPAAHNEPYTGRLYLAFLPNEATSTTPLDAVHSWFNPNPLASWDVENLAPGTPATLDLDNARIHVPDAHTETWATGTWTAQAFARVNKDAAKPGTGAGDPYSDTATIDFTKPNAPTPLTLTNTIDPKPFPATDTDHHFAIRSQRLSAFENRDVTLNAGVRLPENYYKALEENPDATFPVVYIVTGFGGSYHEINRYASFYTAALPDPANPPANAIIVVPDATNAWGHSVFANSEVTGPWGDALVHELIPALEAVYNGAGPQHRYVTGISSGGWSSLWLQLEYPTHFAGAWSHAPDPVDFRAFQTPDIYDPNANYFTDEDGTPRPVARRTDENGNDTVILTKKQFVDRETVLGPGGQIESFEAVFSPALPDGTPMRLFDRTSGDIDSQTADAWRPYDITQKMTAEWPAKRADLEGKLRVYGGEIDNFYLGESVTLLRNTLLEQGFTLQDADETNTLNADADIRLIQGMTHTLYRKGNDAMWNTINHRWQSQNAND